MAQPERLIPAAAALEDVQLARRAVELIHPGYDRYASRESLTAAWRQLEQQCEGDLTEADLFAGLSRVLALCRCSHTKAEPSEGWAAWRESTPAYPPFRFRVEDGRMIVVRSAAKGLDAGDEVVSLNGISAARMMATILEAVPADGWNDDARRFALAAMSDLDESEWDHFLPAFFALGPSVLMEIRRTNEAVSRAIELPLMTRAARLAALNEEPPPENLDEAIRLEHPADGIAVLTVGTFVAYRKPIPPREIYQPCFERLAGGGTKCLILDLRGNGGGSDDAALDLMRFLVDQPVESKSSRQVRTFRFGDLKDRLETWDRSVMELPEEIFRDLGNGYYALPEEAAAPAPPLEPGFRGRLIVLCGPANASGATLFMAGLRARRAATFVGETTGGAVEGPTAGVIFFLPLPNSGIRVRIPAIRTVTGYKAADATGGFLPDVLVRTTAADLVAERDPVLERALELARQSVESQQ